MNVGVTLIPHGGLHTYLQPILGFLQKAELWSNGRSTVDDILSFMFTGQMQLWLVYDADTWKILAILLTEIKEYPRRKMLAVQHCAGEEHIMAECRDPCFAVLENFANDNECHGVEFFGRPGWGAYVKSLGYTGKTVVYEKFFGEQS